jgi:hypothetical protein
MGLERGAKRPNPRGVCQAPSLVIDPFQNPACTLPVLIVERVWILAGARGVLEDLQLAIHRLAGRPHPRVPGHQQRRQ